MSDEPEHLDIDDWEPLSVHETAAAMRGYGSRWWIAGGWAIDLLLGRQSRPHNDMDVVVLRRDQLHIQRHLRHWRLYKTHQPTPSQLAPWPSGEWLAAETGINDIWIKETPSGPWRFQIMFAETRGERWVFRRDHRIGGRLDELGWCTATGVPVLHAHIQLLYKGRLDGRREKDDADFAMALPLLAAEQRRWLAEALRMQFADEHPWIEPLEV